MSPVKEQIDYHDLSLEAPKKSLGAPGKQYTFTSGEPSATFCNQFLPENTRLPATVLQIKSELVTCLNLYLWLSLKNEPD